MSSISSVNSAYLAYLDLASPIKIEGGDLHRNNPYTDFDNSKKNLRVIKVTPVKKKRDLWVKIKHKLENKYEEKVSLKFRKKITFIRDVSRPGVKCVNALYQLALPYIIYVWSIVRFSAETEKEHFSTKLIKGLRKSKVCIVVVLPVGFYDFSKNIFLLAQAAIKNNTDLVAEKGLDIVENVSDLTGNVSTVIEGLEQFGKIASDVAGPLTTWLLGISAALSAITIVRESKRIVDCKRFWKNLTAKKSFADKKEAILNCEEKMLRRVFNIDDGKKFKDRIWNIYVNSKSDANICKKTMNSLKEKVITDNICRGLSIIVGTVCIVAILLLLFTPLATLGFGLLLGATTVGLALLITKEVTKKRFESDMKRMARIDLTSKARKKRMKKWNAKRREEWKKELKKDDNFRSWIPKYSYA